MKTICNNCKYLGKNNPNGSSRGETTFAPNITLKTGVDYYGAEIGVSVCTNPETNQDDIKVKPVCRKIMQSFHVMIRKAGIDPNAIIPTTTINTCKNFKELDE